MTEQMTPLRRRMIDGMAIRNMSPKQLNQKPKDSQVRSWHDVAVSSTSQEVRYPWHSRLRSDAR